ncbi:MAG: cytochrome c oxidase subunit 3 [Pseudomonadota bacterium]|nr:cytochrome c oxidase subunit 3 [Pseudomonadota bacterium]
MTNGRLVAEPEFQYPSLYQQAQTAITGMWLLLAQEALFFGGLWLTWVYARYWNQAGFDAGGAHTELWIGSINTGVLVTSSFVYACALAFIQAGRPRPMLWALYLVVLLGLVFIALKGYEWKLDIDDHTWVNDPAFPVQGAMEGGAKLFWCFYWIGTVLHAIHLAIAIGAVTWVILRARRGAFSAAYHTPVEVTGIFWSFVDIVWMVLWPMIYLIGRVP